MKYISDILKAAVTIALMITACYGVYALVHHIFYHAPPPQVKPVVINSVGKIDTLIRIMPADSTATVKALKKRIYELEHQTEGLNAEVIRLKSMHIGVVIDTILVQYLDSLWPMIAVKYVPSRVVWTGYSHQGDGEPIISDGVASIHAHRFTITAANYGGVNIMQPRWELGYVVRAGLVTAFDAFTPKYDVSIYGTMIHGQVSGGVGVGYDGKPTLRAMIQVMSY
jgi:hypothetical protein